MRSLKKMIVGGVQSMAHQSVFTYRQATWRNRHGPAFIIIGAQKSGTTSLHDYLSQHPLLLPSYEKEVHFFDGGLNPDDDNFEKGLAWYHAHFPMGKNNKAGKKAFETSPLYMFNPLVPQRISELYPDIKLIALLRNPVERAISHYFHVKRRKRETLPIWDALQIEEERLKPIIAQQDYKNHLFIRHSYKSRGLYYEQIKRYLAYFPMENILVMDSERLFLQPNHALKEVFEFVGVDSGFTIPDLEPRNTGSGKSKVESKVYEHLENYFRPHNKNLYELIGENYGW